MIFLLLQTGSSTPFPLFGPVVFGTWWLFLCCSIAMPVVLATLFYGREAVMLLSETRAFASSSATEAG